jgi:hypothetical protein
MLVVYFLVVSLAILVATFFVWRATNSRPSLISGIFGSLAMLWAASNIAGGARQPEMAVGLPILVGMLFGGRAIGTWLRVRKEPMLQQPALTWTILAVLCLGGAAWTYYAIATYHQA